MGYSWVLVHMEGMYDCMRVLLCLHMFSWEKVAVLGSLVGYSLWVLLQYIVRVCDSRRRVLLWQQLRSPAAVLLCPSIVVHKVHKTH